MATKGMKFKNSGQFKKGNIPWSKGKHICFSPNGVFKKGNKINLGRHHSQKTINKISNTAKNQFKTGRSKPIGMSGKNLSEEHKLKISLGNKGKIYSEETRKKIGQLHLGSKNGMYGRCGENNPVWIKDRTLLKRFSDDVKDRRSYSYSEWRKRVLKRDCYQCKINNTDCFGRLEVHHILGFTSHPELRYDINNGITLCHAHHPRKRAEEAELSPYFQSLVAEMK
jgi:hypothetical protein